MAAIIVVPKFFLVSMPFVLWLFVVRTQMVDRPQTAERQQTVEHEQLVAEVVVP
jgi:hypothetical protein